jgi:hypothetical protein
MMAVIAPTEVHIVTAPVFKSRALHFTEEVSLDFEASPKQNCKLLMLKQVT